ncbi:hypothetical protein R1flu_014281 [Riccia fluitans]|uniref:Protein COFACTOR ASSEMBLY OF COMPLEX C SUBUNIT B CCB1, chloroplastic n=1 Tax=Riccia fluitans TaxID=41844 RepID=A0ABD1YG02_9MARC
MVVTMASFKLPSLVPLDGLSLNSAGRKSWLLLPSLNLKKYQASKGVEKRRLALRCSSDRHREMATVQSSEVELGPSFEISQSSERGIIDEEKVASTSSGGEFSLFSAAAAPMLIIPALAESGGYSQASYYTSLGLFVISVPGVWSLIKRSTKSKIVRKTFVVPGPTAENGKAPSRLAGEISSSLARNNFSITDRGEVVTFEGTMVPSRGQAAFLSFCTAVSLGCVALVLTITSPEVGSNWYFLTFLSPLAGFYYWTKASRKEEIKVKMVVADDETSTDVIIQGDDEQIDRLRRELDLREKGMVYVKGLFEQ